MHASHHAIMPEELFYSSTPLFSLIYSWHALLVFLLIILHIGLERECNFGYKIKTSAKSLCLIVIQFRSFSFRVTQSILMIQIETKFDTLLIQLLSKLNQALPNAQSKHNNCRDKMNSDLPFLAVINWALDSVEIESLL